MSKRFLASAAAVLLLLQSGPAFAINATQDTDGDGIPDTEEDANGNHTLDGGETDPYNADSDSGGESDGSEKAAQRNPLDPTDDMTYDADGDGWANGIEIINNTDPKNADSDEDGVKDSEDPFPLDSRSHTDNNANGLPDEWEKSTGLDKSVAVQTKTDDPDSDGLTNAEELARGTDPLSADTDRDGIDDKAEIGQGTNPRENACLSYGATQPFADTLGHWSKPYVTTLRGVSILPDGTKLVRGYDKENGDHTSTTLFQPDQPVTRYEFLKMVTLSTCTRLRTYTDQDKDNFTDVRKTAVINESPDFAFRRYVIYTAAYFKIVEGYEDGTFRPDAPVTRAEAVKILSVAAHLTPNETGSVLPTFSDVTDADWFSAYVSIATSREIARGYDDGTFGPDRPITRAEAAKIIDITMRQNPVINGYVLPEEEVQ